MNLRLSKHTLHLSAVALLFGSALLLPARVDAADPVRWDRNEIAWKDVQGLRGAKEAVLWGDPKGSEHAILNRWNTTIFQPWHVRDSDVRIVVVLGTFTTDVEGHGYKELGPGGIVLIPKGVKHEIGCGPAGACTFVVQQTGPAGVKAVPPPPGARPRGD
jgi:hypothetical protein